MSSVILSIIAGLGGMLGWGASDFFGGLCSRKKGPFITLFWSQSAGLVLTLSLFLFFTVHLNIPPAVAVLLPIAPIFYAMAFLFFYKGFEKGTISIIAATVNLWVVFSMVFLREKINKIQMVGIVVTVFGIIFTAF